MFPAHLTAHAPGAEIPVTDPSKLAITDATVLIDARPPWATDQALIDALPGAVLLLDTHGLIVKANATAAEWLDGPLLGEVWREVCQRELGRITPNGELTTRSQRLLNIATRPLGAQPGQVVLLSDVTESRALQNQVDRNSRLAAMGEMTARLSHQIRTPIATAVLYLTQLQNDPLDSTLQQRFIDRSLARLQHVEKMIRDMLMFAHGAQLTVETVPVNELIAELDVQLAPLIESAGVVCSVRCSSRGQVAANKMGLIAALLNICGNAIENVGDRLVLSVAASDCRGDVLIEIADNGEGIPEAIRPCIFQPFFTTRSDGTGLGLSVVQSIVRAHRGHIDVGDAGTGGALFAIKIPALASVAPPADDRIPADTRVIP